jgi:transposase-like protein
MAKHLPATALQAGRDYPRDYAEFCAWFPDDAACLDYLEWLRWPDGFACPRCGSSRSWRLGDGRFWCESCRRRVSVMTGTIFHRTRTPLTVWFAGAWHMTSAKNGVSAKTLQRVLGFGSYQTAWTMLHRFRAAMIRPDRDRLADRVEVDEVLVGGEEHGGKRGRGAGRKALVGVAVEVLSPKGFGRVRMQCIPDASGTSLTAFVRDVVEPGATVLTDGWGGYNDLGRHGLIHHRTILSDSGDPAHVSMPGVHRVAALLKRWLLGTHQGAVEADHLQGYLDEFAFRFNRRRSGFRGLLFRRLLEQAVEKRPVTYRSLVAHPAPKSTPPRPPKVHQVSPPSLAATAPVRPWRDHNR